MKQKNLLSCLAAMLRIKQAPVMKALLTSTKSYYTYLLEKPCFSIRKIPTNYAEYEHR